MLKTLWLCLLLLQAPWVSRLQSGELLRFHVIAQDDSASMQAIKAPVRDAVQRVYAEGADDTLSMLENAEALLAQMRQAACQAARNEGFTGRVEVTLERAAFNTRVLEGHVIPAGEYPALMVRLGDARGHNWWGLLDPESSLRAALCGTADGDEIIWDWSLRGVFEALLGFCPSWVGG